MFEPVSTGVAITLLVKSAPAWLPVISDALIPPVRDAILGKITERAFDRLGEQRRKIFHLDEKEQKRHLELALKNAAERGLAQFQATEEQQRYNEVINILSTSYADALRREALRLFTLNEEPDFKKLAMLFDQARSQAQSTQGQAIDSASYLSSFFDSLVAELYADPYFRQQISDVLRVRAELHMQRSLSEVLTTLNRIGGTLADNYTPEQFGKDVQAYTAHIERTLRYLKLVGVVPKERSNENRDPELDGIFVPLRIAMQDYVLLHVGASDSLVDLLEQNSCMVLLGGPGSGKSTATRHLAWSHAVANLSNSTSLANPPLLSGKPLPLRIELRRLNEDRRQRPDYDFLTYASEVLLGRAGLNIPRQMFELLLERRTMLVLFDGLDEVATLDDRRTLVEEIESFAQRYPGNRFLVTSRPVGYKLAPLSTQTFCEAQVQPFDDGQIKLFLENWYAHVLRVSPLSPDDRQELEELHTNLKDNPRLHALAENPLLLTVITALHRYERLPDKRILVYDRCADLLLETWARVKGTNMRWQDLQLSKEDQYACVAHLGFVLHERSQQESTANGTGIQSNGDLANDVPLRFMLREVERFLQRQNLFPSIAEQNKQTSRFLDLVKEEAGLIVERGTDENGESLYGFVHRTFQEYFAAADVYERYQQEEDASVISDFLKEHLHDPHWSEVVFLLFGKLKRGPATKQLRQILEGKLKSRRSRYSEVVQQDLFFISTCLIEEIPTESDLVLLVCSRLSDLVRSSPFRSQRMTAIGRLAALAQTKQCAHPAAQVLKELMTYYDLNIERSIEIADALYFYTPVYTEVRQLAVQILFQLAQHSNLSVEYTVQIAENLYLRGSRLEEIRRFAAQLLFNLAHRSDLSAEQAIQATWCLYKYSPEGSEEKLAASQMLLQIPQRHDFTIEQVIRGARLLAEQQSPGKEYADANSETQWATQLLLSLIHRSDLSSEQLIQVVAALNGFVNFYLDEGSWTAQTLLEIAQHTDLTFEETTLIIRLLRIEESTEILFTLAQRSDLSVEQTIQVVQLLRSRLSAGADLTESEEIRQINKMLLALTQRSDLSIEGNIQVLQALLNYGYLEPQENSWIFQELKQLTHRSNITIEQNLQVLKALYGYRSTPMTERGWATQKLLDFAKHNILAAQVLYESSSPQSKERQLASQSLLSLLQRPDISTEQLVKVTRLLGEKQRYLYKSGGNENNFPELQEILQLEIQIFSKLVHGADLAANQTVQVAELLYNYCPSEMVDEQQILTQSLWIIAQNHSLSYDQRMRVVMLPLQSFSASPSDKIHALQTALSLLPEELVKRYLRHYVNPRQIAEEEINLTDIPVYVELSKQELLPSKARDEIYEALQWMVPLFNQLEKRN